MSTITRCPHSDLPPLLCRCPHCTTTADDLLQLYRVEVLKITELERIVGHPLAMFRPILDIRPRGVTWQFGDHDQDTNLAHIPHTIVCRHPHHTGICDECWAAFRHCLADVPAILDELLTALTKDVHFVQHGTRADDDDHPDEAPIEFNPSAAAALDQLARSLDVNRTHIRDRARQLLDQGNNLRIHPATRTLVPRLSSAIAKAHHVIDRPRELWYFGACPKCHAKLWADRDAKHIVCNYQHPITGKACTYAATKDDHERRMLDNAKDDWFTIPELIGCITNAKEIVTRRQIQHWIDHDGLAREIRAVPRWDDGELITDEISVYRLGDVRERARLAELERRGITSAQLAIRFDLTDSAIRKLVQRGILTPIRPGAKPLRFLPEVVDAFETRRNEPTEEEKDDCMCHDRDAEMDHVCPQADETPEFTLDEWIAGKRDHTLAKAHVGRGHTGGMAGTERLKPTVASQLLGAMTPVLFAARLSNGWIKIGHTTNIRDRMKHLPSTAKASSDLAVELVAIRAGGRDDARQVHKILAEYLARQRGFYLPHPTVIALVNQWRADLGREPMPDQPPAPS